MVTALLALIAAIAPVNPVTIPDILGVADISALAVSPDGNWLAFRTERPRQDTDGYQIDWFTVPTNGSAAPRRVADGGAMLFTDAGVPSDQPPIWAPSSRAFYYRALIDGQVQLWRATVAGELPTLLTQDPADIRAVAMTGRGTGLTYVTGATRAALVEAEARNEQDGTLVDASVDLAQPLVRGGLIDGKPATERLTGHWFDRGDLLWRTPSRANVIPLPAGDEDHASSAPSGRFHVVDATAPARCGASATRPADRCVDISTLPGQFVASVDVPGGDARLLTTMDRGHRETLTLWQPAGARSTIAKGDGLLSGDRNRDTPCAVTAVSVACVEASATSPPRLVTFDLKGGRRTILFDPNAELRGRLHVQFERLSWTTKDGTNFAGILLRPAGSPSASRVPLVLSYYACDGFLRGGVGDEVPMLPLAETGIATLCINEPWVDPSTQRGSDYDRAMSGIGAIVDHLARRGTIDRTRVGITGLSFGSEIAYQALWRLPWLRAAATSTGTLDPGFYWYYALPGNDAASALRQAWQVGPPDRDPQSWDRISPLAHVAGMRTPLLMQLPEQEARWSPEFYARLAGAGAPVELYAYASESHIKRSPRHKLAVYGRVLDWFRFWLQGYVDPAVSKSEQYARWRGMAKRVGTPS
jgi:dipeptidyl aminopeptidase/acylaminoacyl peptidase